MTTRLKARLDKIAAVLTPKGRNHHFWDDGDQPSLGKNPQAFKAGVGPHDTVHIYRWLLPNRSHTLQGQSHIDTYPPAVGTDRARLNCSM